MGLLSPAHLYAVSVLEGFDATMKNCSHCGRHIDEDCGARRKDRKAVAVLRERSTRLARRVTKPATRQAAERQGRKIDEDCGAGSRHTGIGHGLHR